MRCLVSGVNTAIQLDPVLRPSPAKRVTDVGPASHSLSPRGISLRIFFLAAVCALLPTISLKAQGRLLTLAMVRPDDLPARRVSTAADHLIIENSTPTPAPSPSISTRTEGLSLWTAERLLVTSQTLQQWRHDAQTVNSLSLSRMSLREFGRPNTWASFEAGYGRLFNDKTPLIYCHNGSWFETPSCGYFRVCFSF
jgi:hypothetical protein